MENITIPVEVPSEITVALNKSQDELKSEFKQSLAIQHFRTGKLTFGKAKQLAGLTRREFEKILADNEIPVSKIDLKQVWGDVEKLRNA